MIPEKCQIRQRQISLAFLSKSYVRLQPNRKLTPELWNTARTDERLGFCRAYWQFDSDYIFLTLRVKYTGRFLFYLQNNSLTCSAKIKIIL